MRRIVAGVDAEGRSYVVSDEDIGTADPALLLWAASSSDRPSVAHVDPSTAATTLEPPPGGHAWMVVAIPPDSDPNALALRRATPGIDDRGFHTTRTLDFDCIISGGGFLDLDEGSIEVHAGDLVVLCAANHAWRNPHDEPLEIMAVLTSLV
jgi:mannose-6-phosphate isomerase-like protein (cupin superfamily)